MNEPSSPTPSTASPSGTAPAAATAPRPDPKQIRQMFASIAGGYDQANTVLSAGIHHLWRRRLVRHSGVHFGDRVLDCATGTGDLALEFKKAVGPTGLVVGTDFCAEMLEKAPAKARAAGLDIKFEVADVTQLPFDDQSFDLASIAFGIRNVADPQRAIAELNRVVKPGGSVQILEFGQPRAPLLRALYRAYSENVLPRLGGWITGRPEAYRYLEKSSARFPAGPAFLEIMRRAAPFADLRMQSLSFGIAYIYSARVPPEV